MENGSGGNNRCVIEDEFEMKSTIWRSMKDDEPEVGERIIAFIPVSTDGQPEITILHLSLIGSGCWFYDAGAYVVNKHAVSHWMPLPLPPDDKAKEIAAFSNFDGKITRLWDLA